VLVVHQHLYMSQLTTHAVTHLAAHALGSFLLNVIHVLNKNTSPHLRNAKTATLTASPVLDQTPTTASPALVVHPLIMDTAATHHASPVMVVLLLSVHHALQTSTSL
jgi:hypothetical protein